MQETICQVQHSNRGWEYADCLIRQESDDLRVFGVGMLNNKIKDEWQEHPIHDRGWLMVLGTPCKRKMSSHFETGLFIGSFNRFRAILVIGRSRGFALPWLRCDS